MVVVFEVARVVRVIRIAVRFVVGFVRGSRTGRD